MNTFALFSRLFIGLLLSLITVSPALAEIGCIADASVHAAVEGPYAFFEIDEGAAAGQPHSEPAGHSAACHFSHTTHNQLPAAERAVVPSCGGQGAARYWISARALVDGREPDRAIRPPRA